MKKIINVLLRILLVGLIVVVVNYLGSLSNVYQFIDQKVIPVLVGVIGAVASLFSFLKPLFLKLDVSNNSLEEALVKVKKIMDENQYLKENLSISVQNVESLQKDLKILIEIVKVGFSNNQELVKNGVANQICKIGEENE